MKSYFDQHSSCGKGQMRGFTLVEMLVVIAIIGTLLSILTPALIGIRRTAKKTREKNNIRQVGVGWNLYSNSNLDGLLPGWLDVDVQTDDPAISSSWAVSYNFPDKHKVPPAPQYAPDTENIAGPWPWRLMSYLDYNLELVHGYLEEEATGALDYSDPDVVANAKDVGFHPAFGYNAYYIGGWWEITSNTVPPRPRPRYHSVRDAKTDVRLAVVARNSSHIKNPSRMIVFCSSANARRMTTSDDFEVPFEIDDDDFGSHYVVPPYLETTEIYHNPGRHQADSTKIAMVSGGAYGVPVARYNSQVALLHADLSVDAQTPGSLLDMRFWVNGATGKRWQHTESADTNYP